MISSRSWARIPGTVPTDRHTTTPHDSDPISACFDDHPKLLNCEKAKPRITHDAVKPNGLGPGSPDLSKTASCLPQTKVWGPPQNGFFGANFGRSGPQTMGFGPEAVLEVRETGPPTPLRLRDIMTLSTTPSAHKPDSTCRNIQYACVHVRLSWWRCLPRSNCVCVHERAPCPVALVDIFTINVHTSF